MNSENVILNDNCVMTVIQLKYCILHHRKLICVIRTKD